MHVVRAEQFRSHLLATASHSGLTTGLWSRSRRNSWYALTHSSSSGPIHLVIHCGYALLCGCCDLSVVITGVNLPFNDTYLCDFNYGSPLTPVTWVSSTKLTCTSPLGEQGVHTVRVWRNGVVIAYGKAVTFNYFGVCPNSACGMLSAAPSFYLGLW